MRAERMVRGACQHFAVMILMQHLSLACGRVPCYSSGDMTKRTLLCLFAVAALGTLPMCDEFDDVPPLGQVRATDPEADALMQAAEGAKSLKDRISSLKELVRYHSLAPCAPKARFMLGQSYEQKGEYRDAFKEYTKLIDRYPQSPLYKDALNRQLALAFSAADGRLKTKVLFGAWSTEMESGVVIEWLKTIMEKAPYNDMAATAASILGKYLVDKDRPEEACIAYRNLVEKYPESSYAPDAQLMLAKLLAESHTRGNQNLTNLTAAQEAYEEFTLRFPHHKEAGKALAEASNVRRLLVHQELEVGRYYLERSHEYTSAVFCFENVIRQKQVNPQAAQEAEQLLQRARALSGNR